MTQPGRDTHQPIELPLNCAVGSNTAPFLALHPGCCGLLSKWESIVLGCSWQRYGEDVPGEKGLVRDAVQRRLGVYRDYHSLGSKLVMPRKGGRVQTAD